MPFRDDLLTPIPGANPSGVNLRYDPVTDKIREARREDLDVPQGDWKTELKAAEFPLVVKLAGDSLAKRSKDLQIAVWLVDAQVRLEGFSVLAPCFQFLREMMEQFWDTLYPPMEDGDLELRAAPLDWLGTKLEEPLRWVPITRDRLSWFSYQESRAVGYEADADTQAKQETRDARISENKITGEQFDESLANTPVSMLTESLNGLTEGLTAVEALAEFCDAQFGSDAPSFLKVRGAIEEIAQTLQILIRKRGGGAEAKPSKQRSVPIMYEPAPVAAEDETPSPDSWDTGEEVAATGSESSSAEITDIEGAERQLIAICRFLRERDPGDTSPYLILRAFRWGELRNGAPPLDSDMLVAPPTELRVNLKKFVAERDWDQVLETTEAAMALPCGRAWLDVQRCAVTALEENGRGPAARAVSSGVRGLLRDFPELAGLNLSDDTPAANAETRAWIESTFGGDTAAPADDATASDSTESTDTDFSFTDDSSTDTTTEEPAADLSIEPEPEPVMETGPMELEDNPPILDASEIPISETNPDIFVQALEAVEGGRMDEGLALITKILATERCGRGRFKRRTQLAHLLLAGGQRKVAQPLLEKLDSEIEQRRLEEWEENEALAYPLELLLRCLASEDDRRTQLYARICSLDPLRAVNCPV